MKLMNDFLDQGHTLLVDIWHKSIGLAEKMTDTLRKNRKGLPFDVKGKKLKRGQLAVQQNQEQYNGAQVEG